MPLTRVGHRHLDFQVGASGQVGEIYGIAVLVGVVHRHCYEIAAFVHIVFGNGCLGEQVGDHLLVGVVLDFERVVAQFRCEAKASRSHIGVQRAFLAVHLYGSGEVSLVNVHLFGILA